MVKDRPLPIVDDEDVYNRARAPSVSISDWPYSTLEVVAAEALVRSNAKLVNWGGTFVCRPRKLFAPTTVEQCYTIVELARRTGNVNCRAIGRAHSPGDIPFTKDWMIDMCKLQGCLSIDCQSDSPSISVLAGTFVSQMHKMLENAEVPLAMRNLGSISEQTIGGLISTASHGTGSRFPVLSAAVKSLQLLCALEIGRGGTQMVTLSREQNPELFNATLCGLGATGLIIEVTLYVDHWFKLKQVSEECRIEQILGRKTEVPASKIWPMTPDLTRKKEGKALRSATLSTSEKTSVRQDNKGVHSLGKLLAHHPTQFPACPSSFLAQGAGHLAHQIYPVDLRHLSIGETLDTHSEATLELLDNETRWCQERLEQIADSAQHVRLAWFAHAGMCTISRMNRTLDPITTPSVWSRAYDTLIGYHLVQAALFYGRYQPSMLPYLNRFAYKLTHWKWSAESRKKDMAIASRKGESIDVEASTPFDPVAFTSERRPMPTCDAPLLDSQNSFSVIVDAAPRVFNVNCLYRQYTDEWAIPLCNAGAALRVMRDWLDEEEIVPDGEKVHFPIEIRFVDADGIWLSPSYGRKTCYIGIVQYRPYGQPTRYQAIFDKYERLMRFFGGRPHWAKAHTCGALELARLYPELPRYLKAREGADPFGIFLNPYVRRHLLGDIAHEASSRIFKSRL